MAAHNARKAREKKIRLLLVDDHPIVLDGIKSHLCAQPEFEIVGEAANGLDALQKARLLLPDVVLMDITMPQMNGLEATTVLRKQAPLAKILILTMHNSKEYIAQMIRAGARGYLLKDGSPAELVHAIKAVHAGEVFFAPSVSRVIVDQLVDGGGRVAEPVQNLTDREREVLSLIAEGLLNKQIADKLGIGVRTIETHRERIMRKLDIHTVAGLTKYAIAQGMTTMP
ncbi:MAG TPA: response regulator transcription factor [Verrucomicrobiae bacterium]|nr:response regulator transcription factor [Verrucomicrobiae bacterium]